MRCCDPDQDGDIELVDLVMIAMNFGSGGSMWRVVPGK